MPGRACRCTAGARILVVRVRLPGAGRRGPAPPECVELSAGATYPVATMSALVPGDDPDRVRPPRRRPELGHRDAERVRDALDRADARPGQPALDLAQEGM